MAPGGFTEALDLYFALVFQNQLLWFTGGGLSTAPGALAQLTPVPLQDLTLVNTSFPEGTVLTFLMFFAEGGTLLTYDRISAVVQ
jgi:hypothetical protein